MADSVYDFICTVCIREKSAYSKAVKYCSQCNVCFCKPCLSQVECDHDLLGRANVARWGTPSTRIQFEQCSRCFINTTHVYCPRADVVCCTVCGRQKTCGQTTSFGVKFKGDKKTCYITGMCQLPGGNIMVTDKNNKSLKQLDKTYKVTSHCALSDRPTDVCNTEMGEVAVALCSKNIVFVSVGDKLTAKSSFFTDHGCYSLTYHNKCLYVISEGGCTVHVYTPSGSLQHTIDTDQHDTGPDTQYITVSPVSERLYVADRDKGLVTLDLQGNLLATCNPPDLQGAGAVCVDGAGNVFVGGYSTNTVLQVSQEGDRQVAQKVSQSDGISTGRLCFDNVNSRLLVASEGSDTVTVLQLAQ